MPDPTEDLLAAFDGHNVEGIRTSLEAGADPCSPVRGKEPIYWLLEEYTRSDRLPECLRLLLSNGATLRDPFLVPVLLDDEEAIRAMVSGDATILDHRTTLVSAFTSLDNVSLLHVAAEYGNDAACKVLVELGADVNARGGIEDSGIGGHTPIFHTVNSNRNRSAPIMRFLAEAGADCSVRLDGLIWGKGYPWETVFFDVTPISYAQMGLLPQVHRSECDIYENVIYLLNASGRPVPTLDNVPNRYLLPKKKPD